MKLSVVVKPRSRPEGVERQPDGSLLVRVHVPPIEGRANERVIELLADHLKVPKRTIRIAAGSRGRKKIIEVL